MNFDLRGFYEYWFQPKQFYDSFLLLIFELINHDLSIISLLKVNFTKLNLSFWIIQFHLRLTIVGCKRKVQKRRNFKFSKENGFDSIHTQSHYSRIIVVKTPRYENGEVIALDYYDVYQSEWHYVYFPLTSKQQFCCL